MAFLRDLARPEPPTAVIGLESKSDPSPITEVDDKKTGLNMDLESNSIRTYHIDPELERKVIRKMDLRVVPLVSALCASCLHLGLFYC